MARIYETVQFLAHQADHFVRERGFSRFTAGTQTLFKVIGVADLALWTVNRAVFDEIPPTKVKKTVTGKGIATKEEVAAALPTWVGHYEYACDDESDAVAVGVAWIKQTEMEGGGSHAKVGNE